MGKRVNTLTEDEFVLVRETKKPRVAGLDEDELIELHTRSGALTTSTTSCTADPERTKSTRRSRERPVERVDATRCARTVSS